jgi:hypothetical protein
VSGVKETSLDETLVDTVTSKTEARQIVDDRLVVNGRSIARVDQKTSFGRVLQENTRHSAVESGAVTVESRVGKLTAENKENNEPTACLSRPAGMQDVSHQMACNRLPKSDKVLKLAETDGRTRFTQKQMCNQLSDCSFKSPCTSNKTKSRKFSSTRTIESENNECRPAVSCVNSLQRSRGNVSNAKIDQQRFYSSSDDEEKSRTSEKFSGKDLGSSSTPVKQAKERFDRSCAAVEPVADVCKSLASGLMKDNNSLSEINLDWTYESTVRLSLPTRSCQPDLLALAQVLGEDRHKTTIGTQTAGLLPANHSGFSSKSSPHVQHSKYDSDGKCV